MKNFIYITLVLAFISCTNKQSSNSSDEETTQSNGYAQTQSNGYAQTQSNYAQTQSNYAQTQSDNYSKIQQSDCDSSLPNVTPIESSSDFVPVITTSSTENTYYPYSEENNSDNRRRYSNYQETDDCVDGVVVYEGSGDYYIIETRRGLTVCETYSGWLSEGDKVRGELNKYNFKYILNKNRDSEVRIYIEEYMLSEESAIKWLGEHNHLKSRDQDYYDSDN